MRTPEPKVEEVLSPASTPLPDSPQQTAEDCSESIEELKLPERVDEVIETKESVAASHSQPDEKGTDTDVERQEVAQSVAKEPIIGTDSLPQEPSLHEPSLREGHSELTPADSGENSSADQTIVQELGVDEPADTLDSSDDESNITLEKRLKGTVCSLKLNWETDVLNHRRRGPDISIAGHC
jgi:hypothetical protein